MSLSPAVRSVVSPTPGDVQTAELGSQGPQSQLLGALPLYLPLPPDITPDQVALPTLQAGESVLPACAGVPSIPAALYPSPLSHYRSLPLHPDPDVMHLPFSEVRLPPAWPAERCPGPVGQKLAWAVLDSALREVAPGQGWHAHTQAKTHEHLPSK